MFDLLKLIAKKDELKLALEGVAMQDRPHYHDNYCVDCTACCANNCTSDCKGTTRYRPSCRILT